MLTRLQKILADAGVASRRKAEEYIAAGRVSVNGEIVTLGAKADAQRDTISLDGKTVSVKQDLVYIMLHKPEGVVTTVSDPQGRKTVMELLPSLPVRIYPVGRLDYDSSGLLLLTNDGKLTQHLTHPKSEIKKTYHAKVKGIPATAALKKLTAGVHIDGKKTLPCKVRMLKSENDIRPDRSYALLQISIHEGRNRQVRKMCECIGHPVVSLKRVAMGTMKLGDLPRGGWRYLSKGEVAALYKKEITK